jgi:hypothetical protein
MVEHLAHNPTIKGLNLPTGTGRDQAWAIQMTGALDGKVILVLPNS